MVRTVSLLFAIALGGAGCALPTASDSLYRDVEVGEARLLKECKVLAVREVDIKAKKDKNYGSIVGALIGATLGSTVGGGSGQVLATEAGAVAGAVVGDSIGDEKSLPGVEYTISDSDGNAYTLVQNYLEGDRIVKVGEACWMQTGANGRNRILPAD